MRRSIPGLTRRSRRIAQAVTASGSAVSGRRRCRRVRGWPEWPNDPAERRSQGEERSMLFRPATGSRRARRLRHKANSGQCLSARESTDGLHRLGVDHSCRHPAVVVSHDLVVAVIPQAHRALEISPRLHLQVLLDGHMQFVRQRRDRPMIVGQCGSFPPGKAQSGKCKNPT